MPNLPLRARSSAGLGLAILAFVNLFNYLDRFVVSALFESLKHSELALSDFKLGFLMTSFLIVYMLTAPVFGKNDWRPGGPPECPRPLRPLPELGLEYFVDVHADPTNAALIDLDLVQTRGRMGESRRRAPIVLPEVRAQAVVQRPIDRL